MTLLILEIKIPKHEDLVLAGSLYNYLFHLWPSYLSYFISAILIGTYWANHHWLFRFIEKTNHVFDLLNVLFLIALTFMPFTSAIFGDFIMEPENMSAAVTTGCVGFILPIPMLIIAWLYATYNKRLVSPLLSLKFINGLTLKLSISFLFSSIALALSFYLPYVSIGIIIMLLIIFLLPPDTPVYDNEKDIQKGPVY